MTENLSANDARGIDLVSEYFNPHIERLKLNQEGIRVQLCEDKWGRDDDDEPWFCNRVVGHAGLHASLVNLKVRDEIGDRIAVTVGALWADEGVLQR